MSDDVPQQADIIIGPDGSVRVSFLWDDLRGLGDTGAAVGPAPGGPREPAPAAPPIDVDLAAYAACRLCPRACGFDRTRAPHPRCGGPELRVATAGRTFGDEPCIAGERGSGAVFLAGCPLRCPSCHNPELRDDGVLTPPAAFVALAWRLRDEGAENLQLLSPTAHRVALAAVLRALKAQGFDRPIVWKTSGYETIAAIDDLAGLVDVWLPDLKYGPDSAWAGRAGAPAAFAVTTAAIARMRAQVGPARHDERGRIVRGVLVRHVPAPLPTAERAAIAAALARFAAEGVVVSRTAVFDVLE